MEEQQGDQDAGIQHQQSKRRRCNDPEEEKGKWQGHVSSQEISQKTAEDKTLREVEESTGYCVLHNLYSVLWS